jgi:hypothetical protein
MIIFNGKFGGLSNSKYSGIEGSLATCVGIDGHSTPGLLKVRQMLEKESGTTVSEFCKVKVALSTGINLWFSSTSGKVWAESAGTYVLVATLTATAGGVICLGAEEYDGYVYMATESRLHRIAIASATITPANWTAGLVLNWATFLATDSEYHPMVVQGVSLFIGDGKYIAKVSGTPHAFENNKLDLKSTMRIKTMAVYDIDIVIGPVISNNVNKTEILRWDTESESWTTSDPIEEDGINAFIRDDNYLYANCGQAGSIYFYDGQNLVLFQKIPGDWSPSKTAEIYPNAVATLQRIPIFGLSNLSGNPTLQGVYCLGSYSASYTKVIDLSYPVSAGLSTIKIGAIIVRGSNMWVSWTNGTTSGIDKLNWSKKYTSAYIETMMLNLDEVSRSISKSITDIIAGYASMPTNTKLNFKTKRYADDSWSSGKDGVDDTNLRITHTKESIPDLANLQVRIDFTVSSNDAPEIDQIIVQPALEKDK